MPTCNSMVVYIVNDHVYLVIYLLYKVIINWRLWKYGKLWKNTLKNDKLNLRIFNGNIYRGKYGKINKIWQNFKHFNSKI